MCGVSGYLNTNGRAAETGLVEKMLDRIPYRGPDDRGTWAEGPVALGLCRLSILDLSPNGHQPFVTADGLGVLSYNGEVYNFRELRAALEKEGVRFRSSSDTEAVLYALHQWGPEKAVGLLNGMFAFAYYDLRRSELWLGRDRLGIKPFYFSRTPGALVFASEIKALTGHPEVRLKPDYHSLTTQVLFSRLDGTWTPFENVESVLPGTVTRFSKTGEETFTYFEVLRDLDPARIASGESVPAEKELARFEELFSRSVSAHLTSDAPLAAMCSGGLDSSLMAAFAATEKTDMLAYVADIEGGPPDEVLRAKKVCAHLKVPLREVPVPREEFCRLWPFAVYHNDQPNFFPQNVAVMAIARAARRDGFKVLLAGEGSDELFGGYEWQAEAYKMWRLRRLHSLFIPDRPFWRKIGRVLSKLAPLDLDRLGQKPFNHLNPWVKSDLEGPRILGLDAAKRYLRHQALFKKLQPLARLEDRAFLARCFEDLYVQLPTALTSNDKMGMAESVEIRFPFLSNELIDFGIHLPCRMKYSGGQGKWLVKKSAEKRLPRDIVYARKIGFGIAHFSWEGTEEILKNGRVAEFLKWSSHDWPVLRQMIWEEPAFIYHLVSMELWMRMYFEGEKPERLAETILSMIKKTKS